MSYVCSHSPINRTIARNANPNSITVAFSRSFDDELLEC